MNLTQLEWIKTELKRRFYGLNKTSGKTDLTEETTYSKEENVF